MDSTPWVTVLTPLFNGIEYYKECYDSVIAQTDTDWTWIVGVNGHGEDNELYNKLKKIDDPRIVVKNYLTIGKVDTLNKMLSEVSSNYIAIVAKVLFCMADEGYKVTNK